MPHLLARGEDPSLGWNLWSVFCHSIENFDIIVATIGSTGRGDLNLFKTTVILKNS